MAWWLTVYCRKPVDHLTAEQIAAGLRDGDPEAPAGVDYPTLAEGFELADEEDAEAALAQLRVEPVSDRPLDLEIRYRPEPDARPIVVHLWSDPARVAEEIEEALTGRDPTEGAMAWVPVARQIVGIELGYSQLDEIGVVIAYELARYLAQKGDGVIVDDEGEWFAVEDGALVEP